mmetsp:Transcript_12990/g.22837  ORF Transcript_12990/g.22837 Transcript_12990/m.22837 type:complete len:226 (-) Transcript_12990:2298-2975(-)
MLLHAHLVLGYDGELLFLLIVRGLGGVDTVCQNGGGIAFEVGFSLALGEFRLQLLDLALQGGLRILGTQDDRLASPVLDELGSVLSGHTQHLVQIFHLLFVRSGHEIFELLLPHFECRLEVRDFVLVRVALRQEVRERLGVGIVLLSELSAGLLHVTDLRLASLQVCLQRLMFRTLLVELEVERVEVALDRVDIGLQVTRVVDFASVLRILQARVKFTLVLVQAT